MEDVALFNIKGKDLVTEEERTYLFDCIKTEKHYEYYNILRGLNKSFLIYKGFITTERGMILEKVRKIEQLKNETRLKVDYSESINNIIKLITDKEQRKIATKQLINNIDKIGGEINEEGFYEPLGGKETAKLKDDLGDLLAMINFFKKTYYNKLEVVTKGIEKHPFTAYRIFIKQSDYLMKENEESNLRALYSLASYTTKDKFTDENREELGDNFIKSVTKVKEVELDRLLTKQDVENFKRAGI